MILIVNGSEPAKHRLQPHTRARHSSWRACASDALQAARVASEAGTTCSCCTSQLHRSVLAVYATAAACGIALVQLGDAGPSAGLIQCERTLCVAAGRWQCTAAHRLWRLECPRQQCWSLTCVLGPQQTAAVATAAACCCLIQSSQRCSEACRIRAVWYLLRLSAFRLGDRSWMVRWSSASSIEPSMAGRRSVRWRAERCTARREKHGSDAMSLLPRSL